MPKKIKIWTKILFIVALAVLPTVVITLYSAHVYQATAVRDSQNMVARLCEGYTNEQRLIVNNARQMMIAVSQIRSIQSGNYEMLDQYFETLLHLYEDYATILLADDKGIVQASGVYRTGYSLADRDYFQAAIRTGNFTIGEFITSRSTGQASLAFCYPVADAAGTFSYLVVAYSLDKYTRELSASRLPEGFRLEIFDRFGRRLFALENGVIDEGGLPVPVELFDWVQDKEHHHAGTVMVDGSTYMVATGSVSDGEHRLFITVRAKNEMITSLAVATGLRSILLMLASCAAAVVLSLWLARRLFVDRIEQVTAYTNAVASGNLSVRLAPNRARDEVTDLIDAFNTMTATLENRNAANHAMLEEKEVLLLELQKRVSDNLQILSSLVNLQIEHSTQEVVRQSLLTAHSRIMALALVYETIYRFSDVQKVGMHRYCNGLCDYLVSLYTNVGTDVSCLVSGVDTALGLDKAIPLGLILNEMVSNCLLHAFPEGYRGIIQILFFCEDSTHLTMQIIDNGVGFDTVDRRGGSLGFEMTEALVEQINGELRIKSGREGSVISICLPVDPEQIIHSIN